MAGNQSTNSTVNCDSSSGTKKTKGQKKKSPSKLRRDTKRREVYVAKKNESSAAVSLETPDLQKEKTATPVPCTPRRKASPSRRFCSFSNKEEVEDSPIPQLDGADNRLDLDSEDCKTECTKEDLVKMLKEMIADMNKIGEDNNDVFEDNSILSNEEDDNFEGVKLWALNQKKLT